MAVSTLNPPSSSTLNSTTAAITSTSPPANEHYDIDNDFDSPSKIENCLIFLHLQLLFIKMKIISSQIMLENLVIQYHTLLPNHYRQIFLLLWLKQGKGSTTTKSNLSKGCPLFDDKENKASYQFVKPLQTAFNSSGWSKE